VPSQRKRDGDTEGSAKRAATEAGSPAAHVEEEAHGNPYEDSTVQERTVFVSNLLFKVTVDRLRVFLAKVVRREPVPCFG